MRKILFFILLFLCGTLNAEIQINTAATGDMLQSIYDPLAIGADIFDHGNNHISSLADDDHLQYGLLLGRSGGQTFIGGTDASDNLILQSTSNATKGKIFFGANSVYDEVNDRLGIGTPSPSVKFKIEGSNPTDARFQVEETTNNVVVDVNSGTSRGFIGTVSDHPLRLKTGGQGQIEIDTSGNTELLNGFFSYGSPTELTISGGVVTATKSYHTIDTEGDAATDDLDTINGGSVGRELILTSANSTRDTTLKHGTGNLRLSQGNDFTLDNVNATIQLLYNGTNWIEQTRSANL